MHEHTPIGQNDRQTDRQKEGNQSHTNKANRLHDKKKTNTFTYSLQSKNNEVMRDGSIVILMLFFFCVSCLRCLWKNIVVIQSEVFKNTAFKLLCRREIKLAITILCLFYQRGFLWNID